MKRKIYHLAICLILVANASAQTVINNDDLIVEQGHEIKFKDNGQITSFDPNHGIFFHRTDNLLELREYGDIVLKPLNGRVRIEGSYENGNIGGSLTLRHTGKTSAGAATDWVMYNMSGVYGNALQFWAYDQIGCQAGGLCASRFTIMDNGKVGIGTNSPSQALDVRGNIYADGNIAIGTTNPGTFKLAVEGKIGAREIQVTASPAFPDYVFDSNYKLRSLSSLEQYINQNKHLPGVPSADEVEKNGGIELGKLNTKLLEKVEELTLYMIEMKKENEKIKKENVKIRKEIKELKQSKSAH
jgi:Phage T4 tail fibre